MLNYAIPVYFRTIDSYTKFICLLGYRFFMPATESAKNEKFHKNCNIARSASKNFNFKKLAKKILTPDKLAFTFYKT